MHNSKSLRKGNLKIISEPKTNKYVKVYLSKNGVGGSKKLHRIIAQAFIPNPKNKKTINHIDSNKSNNEISNLEWATYSENNLHCIKYGKRKFCVDNEKIIRLYEKGYTMWQIGEIMGISKGTICKILKEMNIKTRPQGKKRKFVEIEAIE